MQVFFDEVRQMLIPGYDARHGPLPLLLVTMTLVTGLIDAFSYIALHHVFVANMTGNVIFLAFASAGGPGFSIRASLLALACFLLGALGGGFLGSHLGHHRGRLLSVSATIQALLLAIATLVAWLAGHVLTMSCISLLILVLGLAMGLQNATARKLAVPDLTTTVITQTIVGLAADAFIVGGSGAKAGRRGIAVVTLFLGALIGSMLVFHFSFIAPLIIAFVLTLLIGATAHWSSRGEHDWTHPASSARLKIE
jgi:uncharacterized membrane protein YoaK (UPF0700 family)